MIASPSLSRRVLIGGSLAVLSALTGRALAQGLVDPKTLKPGKFDWRPDLAPTGPVVVIVSLPGQRVTVYRNGVRIGASTCSTGRPGHKTPTGTFLILQKAQDHKSTIYDGAPMPYMERLTWSGIALHAGDLPGYPASHGCVRLPLEFAKLLFGVTQLGTPVIVADQQSAPEEVLHPALLLPQAADNIAAAATQKVAKKTAHPPNATTESHDAVALIASVADRKLYVVVDGHIAFDAPLQVAQPNLPFGTHVFALIGASNELSQLKWMAVGIAPGPKADVTSALLVEATIKRLQVDDATAHRVAEMLHPGSTFVVTDQPAQDSTRTKPGFAVMTS